MGVVIVLGAWGWAGHQRTLREHAEAALVGLEEKRDAVAVESAALEQRLAQAATAGGKLRTALAKPATVPAEAGATANNPWERFMRRDPAMQAADLAVKRAREDVEFGPWLRKLGLSPEQEAQFFKNRMIHAERVADVQAAGEMKNLSDWDRTLQELIARANDDYASAQRALLGEDGFRRTKEFELTLPLRGVVRDLATATLAAGQPLTQEQAEGLAKAVVPEARLAKPDGTGGLADVDWRRVDGQARAILNDRQFAIFQTTEPKMEGWGARFMARLRRSIADAQQADAAATAKRPGG